MLAQKQAAEQAAPTVQPEMPSPAAASKAPAKTRFVGIDIIKILAAFLVPCVHIFLYTGFYNEPITESFGLVPICLRWVSYCCVPLFMLVSGYLMKNKTLSKDYYKGLIRILVIYLICSVICAWFNTKHFRLEYTPWSFISGIFTYSNAKYAWYIEYYITLFLLIPFINLAFNTLKTRRAKRIMVITVVLLSIVAPSLYIGTDRATQFKLLPGYFSRWYPIGYYLIGCYIRQYPPERTLRSKFSALTTGLLSLAWLTLTTYEQSLQNVEQGCKMLSWHYNDYGSWPVALLSTSIFLLLFDITCSCKPIQKLLQTVGNATLATFLISYVFDSIFHGKNSGMYPTVPERLAHGPMLALKIFGCSLAVGLLIHGVYDAVAAFIQYLRKPKKTESTTEQ